MKPKDKIVRILADIVFAVAIAAAIIIPLTIRERSGLRREKQPSKKLELGEKVTFGNYNNEPVKWRVIHFSDDGKTAVLITDNIITMKAYDAAESERFNTDNGVDYWDYRSSDFEDKSVEAKVRGNSNWEGSTIRTWLNSDEETVDYGDGPPIRLVMSERKNGYDREAGFLNGFTEEEIAVIAESQIESKCNETLQEESAITNDRVFLLNIDELSWLDEAKVNIYAIPTQAAVEQDDAKWYNYYSLTYDIDYYCWWLREPVEGSASRCYMVSNGYTDKRILDRFSVGTEGFGIRPAVTVNVVKFQKLIATIATDD